MSRARSTSDLEQLGERRQVELHERKPRAQEIGSVRVLREMPELSHERIISSHRIASHPNNMPIAEARENAIAGADGETAGRRRRRRARLQLQRRAACSVHDCAYRRRCRARCLRRPAWRQAWRQRQGQGGRARLARFPPARRARTPLASAHTGPRASARPSRTRGPPVARCANELDLRNRLLSLTISTYRLGFRAFGALLLRHIVASCCSTGVRINI